MTFTLAIIGRPNVGKSTLFNKMTGRKLAIVNDMPGVTRDWQRAQADLYGLKFDIVDTAGLEEEFTDTIESRMRQQTESALIHADMALMMIDGREGVMPMDRHFADWLRGQDIPVILAVNKSDTKVAQENIYEAYELGLGDPLALSAEHGIGFSELKDMLKPHIEKYDQESAEDEEDEEDVQEADFEAYEEGSGIGFGDVEDEDEGEDEKPIKIAVVGRPNVGKSTLVNALLGEQRMMTGPEAGITRDAVSIPWEYKGRPLTLVDTAGMRKKAKIVDVIEKDMIRDAIRAIRLAQVVVLVVEANAALERQDLTIADHVIREGRALVIAVNKWDDVKDRDETLKDIQYKLDTSLTQVKQIPVVTISALNKKRLPALMRQVFDVYDLWNRRVPTAKLNRWLSMMTSHHPAPLSSGRPNRVRYMTQIKSRPPSFAVWVSRPKDIPASFERYLVNGLRDDFDLPGVPIRLFLRTSKNPFKN